MSKLSEACKNLKDLEETKISDLSWEAIAGEVAKDILDLKFDIIDFDGKSAVLGIRGEVKENLIANVKINFAARTTPYTIYVCTNHYTNKDLLNGKVDNTESQKTFTNLSTKLEEVDVGELKYYIEKSCNLPKKEETKKTDDKAAAKKKLNEEIDNGYKNDRRAPLGGETLENDIAFNDYLHRKFNGLV